MATASKDKLPFADGDDMVMIGNSRYYKYTDAVVAVDYTLWFSMCVMVFGTAWSIGWHFLLTPRVNWILWGVFITWVLFHGLFKSGESGIRNRNRSSAVITFTVVYTILWIGHVANFVVQLYYLSCSKLSTSCASCNDNTPPATIVDICEDAVFQRVRGGNVILIGVMLFLQAIILFAFLIRWAMTVGAIKKREETLRGVSGIAATGDSPSRGGHNQRAPLLSGQQGQPQRQLQQNLSAQGRVYPSTYVVSSYAQKHQ